MKVLHIIGGGDTGGAKTHVLLLVKELSNYISVKMVSLRPGEFSEEGLLMGIDIAVVNSGNILRDIKDIEEIISKDKFDIIHSHGAKANMISAIIKKHVNLPTVTTVHSDYRLDYLRSKFKMLTYGIINTIALRFIDNYIAVSNNFHEMLRKRGFNERHIFTLYNGIRFNEELPAFSREQFSSKYGISLNEENIIIGNLSRLDPVKRLDIYLKAAAIVLKSRPDIIFLIGGDGPQLAELKRKAIDLGISKNVHFLGWVDRNEFFQCIDINVLTSISESFSYAILEGIPYKKATVCSRVGGFPDLINSGKTGYLFEPGNYGELSGYLLELITNKELRIKMGEELFQDAKNKFSIENMCSSQLEIYKSIQSNIHSKQLCDIVISGYYGFGNSGDESILAAIINSLQMLKKDIKITVLSKKPDETEKKHNVISKNRFNPLHVLNAIKNSKMFMYGGGNLIQDDTSTRSLLYYLSLVWFAKRLGNKVMLYANGIGPIKRNELNKIITRVILNQVDIITLREELSLHELQKLNINLPKVIVTADVALTLKPIDQVHVEEIFGKEGISLKQKFVGISVRDVSILKEYENWKGLNYFIDTLANFSDHLIEEYRLQPLFIPMQNPNDLEIINKIVKKMKNTGYIIKNKYSESEILGIVSSVEVMIGMRLHSLIYAASSSIPFIGLVYQPKVDAFINSLGQSTGYRIENVNFDGLNSLFTEVWVNRDRIRIELKEKIKTEKEKAFKNASIALDLLEHM
ncbi:MAG TPA: polysaccharide pyruvyl transferase CsaB [Clostridia bacterium]|nr:polysaccharide pyruvyl transferase CsaB [Clostridia bacterium]